MAIIHVYPYFDSIYHPNENYYFRLIGIDEEYNIRELRIADFTNYDHPIKNSAEVSINAEDNSFVASSTGGFLLRLVLEGRYYNYGVMFVGTVNYNDTELSFFNQFNAENTSTLYDFTQPVLSAIMRTYADQFARLSMKLNEKKCKFANLIPETMPYIPTDLPLEFYPLVTVFIEQLKLNNTRFNLAANISALLLKVFGIAAFVNINNGNNIHPVPRGIMFGRISPLIDGRAYFSRPDTPKKGIYYWGNGKSRDVKPRSIVIYTDNTHPEYIDRFIIWFLNLYYLVDNAIITWDVISNLPYQETVITYQNDVRLTGYYCIKYNPSVASYYEARIPTVNMNNISTITLSTYEVNNLTDTIITVTVKLITGAEVIYTGLLLGQGAGLIVRNGNGNLSVKGDGTITGVTTMQVKIGDTSLTYIENITIT